MNIEIEVERIASGGEGVGRLPDGKVVFVPRAAPGDTLQIDVLQSQKRFSRGVVTKIVTAGPDRIPPACPHYEKDECGSCQLQHLSYEAQLAAKASMVGDSLRRLGGFDLPDPEIEAAANPWGYRSKITLAAKETETGRVIGFHNYRDPDLVFQLDECHIATDVVRNAWKSLAEAPEKFPPDLTKVVIREASGALQVVLWSDSGDCNATSLLDALEAPASIWVKKSDYQPVLVAGEASTPPLAFEQSSADMAQEIREHACEALGDVSDSDVLDLFCGMGITAGMLSEKGARVIAVDNDVAAIGYARKQYPGVTFRESGIENSLPYLGNPSAIVLNPPRTGLSKPARKWLAKWSTSGAKTLAYISCDPATLARDVKGLEMKPVLIRAFDLFPQTSHVETLAVFRSE
jgi:23S rRNA (uracil1939-C5)-methyltransferase